MDAKPREILCTACGAETLLRIEPVYEGFKKAGERLLCASCGHEFPPDQVPYKEKKTVAVFSEADRVKKVDVFAKDDKGRNCRYCGHYVVNPFVQRCALTNQVVQAMDVCERFERRKPGVPPKTESEASESTGDALADRLKEENRRRRRDIQ